MNTCEIITTFSRASPAWGSHPAALRMPGSDQETLIEESAPGNYFQVLGLKPGDWPVGRRGGCPGKRGRGCCGGDLVLLGRWTILGRRMFYDDAPKTIIGVLPRA
jgi:hypothetical protein